MTRIALLVLLFFATSAFSTVRQTDGTVADFQAKVNASVDGDTVTLPAGTFIWNSNPSAITKAIQVIGAGPDSTHVIQAAPGIPFNFVAHPSDFIFRFSGIHTSMASANSSGTPRLQFSGNQTMTFLAPLGTWVGGFRIDHSRWTDTPQAPGNTQYPFRVIGWNEGVIDHCKTDYADSVGGSETIDVSMPTSPTGVTTPLGTSSSHGEWSWYMPWMFGNDFHGIYLENNIWHKGGIVSDQLSGGGRIVNRHNSSRGSLDGHGLGSGNNLGPSAIEDYNNYIECKLQGGTSFKAFAWRGGAGVGFNNRMTNYLNPMFRPIFERYSAVKTMLGASDGTSPFDVNQRGSFSYNGHSFDAIRTPGDPWVGSVYFSGNSSTGSVGHYTLIDLDSGGVANLLKGMTIRNEGTAAPESMGGKTNDYGPQSWGLILSSASSGGNTVITLAGSTTTAGFALGASDPYTIRKVVKASGVAGNGPSLFLLNNGRTSDALLPMLLDPVGNLLGSPNPRYNHGAPVGLWQWDNKRRNSATSSYTTVNDLTYNVPDLAPGGTHNGEIPPWYPMTQPADADHLRIGADWADSSERIEMGQPDAAMRAGGSQYPHPLTVADSSPAPTPTATATGTATAAPTATATGTASATATVTPTASATAEATATETPTATATATETPTPTATETPVSTPTVTPEVSVTPTATEAPSPTPTATAMPTPGAPQALRANAHGSGQIDLRWTLVTDPLADGIYVERCAGGCDNAINWYIVNIVSPQATRLSDIQLPHQKKFWYRIRTHTLGGYSNYSNVATATTR